MFLEKSFIGKNKWYLYLVVLVLVFVMAQVGGIPFAVYAIVGNMDAFMQDDAQDLEALSQVRDTAGLALMLFSFMVGLFALILFAKVLQKKKFTDYTTGRARWDVRRFGFGALVWGILVTVVTVQQVAGDTDVVFNFSAEKFFPLLVVGLLLFPFQTGFEEVLFRGYLMQGSALLFRRRWAALLATSLLFGLMHSANPEIDTFGFWTAMPQYVIMGLIMGYVALKDDGIELAAGMHFANNLLSSLLVTSDGMVFDTAAIFRDLSPEVSWIDTLVMAVCGVVFILVCRAWYGFRGKVDLSAPLVPPALPLSSEQGLRVNNPDSGRTTGI